MAKKHIKNFFSTIVFAALLVVAYMASAALYEMNALVWCLIGIPALVYGVVRILIDNPPEAM